MRLRTKPAATPDASKPWRVEGAADPSPPAGSAAGAPRRPVWQFLLVLTAFLVANYLIGTALTKPETVAVLPYTEFLGQLDQNNVQAISAKGDTIQGTLRVERATPQGEDSTYTRFTTERPTFAEDDLLAALRANAVEVKAESLFESPSLLQTILVSVGPTLLLVGVFVFGSRYLARRAGGMGGIGGLGRTKAVRVDAAPGPRTTFVDVAGIDEVEEQLVEIVDMLKDPDRYHRVGAKLPKGVLLSGLPGTGKTLLARAVAGEADVPFFSASASEFIEMIVGVGASRVRDLFAQAKKVAPSIIFIDELDAIGRARGGSSFGGVDEREQTLNQILTEMDGFTGAEGVIVIAATNRPEVLDVALLRPGRFDRRIVVNPPDIVGRRAILEVHSRSVPLGPDADLGVIAATTPGMVGADLANLINEAALLAAKRGERTVALADFTDALEGIVLGAERHITLSHDERSRTAYHEGGHALLGMLLPGADPVRKISIIPRGNALGVTFQAPSADRYGFDEVYLKGRITGALGGRAAEQVVFGNVTTGAESDLEQVTGIARQMVGRWGMSAAIGPITVLPGINGESWFPGDARSPSEATRQLVDEATRQLVEECYRHALQLLGDNRERLERLATALLASETLDEHDAYQAAGIGHDTSRSALGALAAAAPLTPVDDAEPDIGRAGNQRPLLEPSASEV
ncbi:MAG: ATP-dependent zinc metalloprotease FtsH [Acidimicrobiia bacterium]